MPKSSGITRRTILGGLVASAFGIGMGKRTALAQSRSEIDIMVEAARAESELVFYCATPESAPRRTIDGFTETYGVKASFIRISSVALQTRYSNEAQAGAISADLVILSGNAVPFGKEGLKNGWFQPVADAALPVIKSGQYPQKFLRGDGIGAVIQIAPWLILYNTDIVKGNDIPKNWPDLLNPKFKGQLVLADIRASDAYLDEWSAVLSRYGEGYFDKLRALAPRVLGDGVQAAQAVGAGQFGLHFPIVPAQATDLQKRGAPVQVAAFDYTAGVEATLLMSNPTKIKHPNAARLFANYLLSAEGNKRFSADPGSVGVYASGLPKEYQAPKGSWSAEERLKYQKLLGMTS